MAIEMTLLEINRWNSDDQAVAELSNAHWNCFFSEPQYSNARGQRTTKHKNWHKALLKLKHAADHLQGHTPEYRLRAAS